MVEEQRDDTTGMAPHYHCIPEGMPDRHTFTTPSIPTQRRDSCRGANAPRNAPSPIPFCGGLPFCGYIPRFPYGEGITGRTMEEAWVRSL